MIFLGSMSVGFRNTRRLNALTLPLKSRTFGTSRWQFWEQSTPIASVPERGPAPGWAQRRSGMSGLVRLAFLERLGDVDDVDELAGAAAPETFFPPGLGLLVLSPCF
jgi:hypothetical protein